ncbi:MAG: hypothetical protein JW913_08115 [Chitinispirillaceae bacterium]|nr:hypothetical protein [Chitinispirillaceae bacterium]
MLISRHPAAGEKSWRLLRGFLPTCISCCIRYAAAASPRRREINSILQEADRCDLIVMYQATDIEPLRQMSCPDGRTASVVAIDDSLLQHHPSTADFFILKQFYQDIWKKL